MPGPLYSIVIPVHNEEADVKELASRIEAYCPGEYEIIFVDDGSVDRTWDALRQIHSSGKIRLIRFRRNFGKAAALMAGFAACRGDRVFTMDGDLQDDPAEMPRFVEKLEEGFGLVCGWKKRRYDPTHKVIASRIFNFVVRKGSRLELHDMNCGFKLFSGEAARSLRIYGELHRFIPVFVAHQGFPVAEIEVQHHARQHGQSKYGMSRLLKGFMDFFTALLLTRFAGRPSHGFGWMAILCLIHAAVLFGLVPAIALLIASFPPDSLAIAFILPLFYLVALGSGVLGVGAVALVVAGWVAELVVAPQLAGMPSAQYIVEEQLD